MNARERLLAVLNGEEPDKVPVFAADLLRSNPQGGWARRLVSRGLGLSRLCPPYKPIFLYPYMINPYLEDVRYIQAHYLDKGVAKCRHTLETPVGSVTCVTADNPFDSFSAGVTEEYFVKKTSDWQIMNYIFREIIDILAPNYDDFKRQEDALGETGITVAAVEKTPFQRAWIELATLERTCRDFKEKPDELLEFLDIQKRLHERAAEITAGSPAKIVDIMDNMTNIISPVYYREYCIPFYEIYSKALEGTGKVLACHMDGLLGQLTEEIVVSPVKVIESLTVPPTGDVSLSKAKAIWPDKILFINCPPHLTWAEPAEIRSGYSKILEEWGSKLLAIEHVEDIPLEKIELHLSSALDVCGY